MGVVRSAQGDPEHRRVGEVFQRPYHLRLPEGPWHRRSAPYGQGYARAFGAGAAHCARGPGGERRRDRDPPGRRVDAIRAAGLELAVDPLGGAAIDYWEPINAIYELDIAVINPLVDPTFSFMTVDHDGAIRMDCSVPYAMARRVGLEDRYRVAFGNDADADRHGIVTPAAGLMNPNRYLSVAILYLLTHRPDWPAAATVGKTLVSSSMIDRVVEKLGRRLSEVPVGFKWFAPGLFDGSYCFGGEESAGASFLRHDGT